MLPGSKAFQRPREGIPPIPPQPSGPPRPPLLKIDIILSSNSPQNSIDLCTNHDDIPA